LVGGISHDVLWQCEQALLWLLDQECLDVMPAQEVITVLTVALLHLVITVQAV